MSRIRRMEGKRGKEFQPRNMRNTRKWDGSRSLFPSLCSKGASHFLCRRSVASVWLLDEFDWFHAKAEASFTHSKRFAHHETAVHVGASGSKGAMEPRGSVWSARSLLPLCLSPASAALW